MGRVKYFVKVSGDEFKSQQFLTWISELALRSYVVICVGGGTQINEELKRRGFTIKEHGPLGRESASFEERQIARDILEINAMECEDLLANLGIHARVIVPVLDVGGVLCHVNGDQMIRTAYLGYDSLFVVTTPDRQVKKKTEFAELKQKVQVIAFR